jgi:hypothetical protein
LDIEAALERAERALDEGRSLAGTGFRRAVSAARHDRSLADRYADRMADIDRRAFERSVRLRVPAAVGLFALGVGSVFGALAVLVAVRAATNAPPVATLYRGGIDAYHWRGFVPIAFLLGTAALVVGTHSLTHWIVGRAVGIRFTHVFLGGPPPPRPGVKSDYATYLRASPRSRAVMHASGAVVTKIVPFALLPVSLRLYAGWPWLAWVLVAIGVVQVITDVLLSTKTSDWMKVRRELRSAR